MFYTPIFKPFQKHSYCTLELQGFFFKFSPEINLQNQKQKPPGIQSRKQ